MSSASSIPGIIPPSITRTGARTWLTHAQTLSTLVDGILRGGIRVVDLTVPLDASTQTIRLPPQFAPSKPFALEEISRYDERGPAWYWNNISCGEHTGTHFDAPVHWVTGKDYPTTRRTTFRSSASSVPPA